MAKEQKSDFLDFINLFNGLYNVAGGTEGAEKALSFLKAGNADKKVQACLVVASKPADLLFSGQSKGMMRNRKKVTPIDIRLSEFLPQFSKSDLDSMEAVRRGAMQVRRAEWPDQFKNVNLTQCRRIAFAAIVFLNPACSYPVLKQWRGKFTSLEEASSKMAGQTKAIFEDQVIKFEASKSQMVLVGLSKFLESMFKPP